VLEKIGVDGEARLGLLVPERLGVEAHAIDRHRRANTVRPGVAEIGVRRVVDLFDDAGLAAQVARQPRVVRGGDVLDRHPLADGEERG
jgi:hypothetical protein